MAIDLFKNHGVVLNSLICETMMCTPESWDEGNFNIKRVNDSIVCTITNNEEESRENASDNIYGLCEKLFYYMANTGSEWTNAKITYSKNGSLSIETQFAYRDQNKNDHMEIVNLPITDSELSVLVNSFIKSYEEWNAFAFERRDISKNTTTDPSYQSYKKLIETYCFKDKRFQGLAYGSESSHSLRDEKIVSVIQSGEYGIVNTLNTKAEEHEYHFIYIKRWFLDELYYVDSYSGRKYECL